MRKSIFLLALAVLSLHISQTHAQVTVGLKGGANVSQLPGLDFQQAKAKALFGFHAGGFVLVKLGLLGIQPELLYSTQGAKYDSATGSSNLKFTYMNVPVMIKLNTKSGFYLESGPQFGFNVGAKFNDKDIKETIKSSDLSWGFGLGVLRHSLGLGLRYNIGISKVSDASNQYFNNVNYKNGVIQASIYFKLFGK